ncbi:zinc ribbon domain-containing protein [Corynebacterium nasicanis]|uniref:Zinc ribbon domain-containing protein n=1 Tax=Corynebacterium nasicanis TaxID=1448267 RepID=A0ABW1Q8A5_9CORY
MKLDPTQQILLLELANTERSLDVVGDTAFVTPEQQEVERLVAEQQRMLNASAAAQMAVDDMEADILRIQEDERKLRKRAADDKAQLSAETDPVRRRDLEHDRYSAKSRIADLMGELTECHNQIHALRNNRDNHGARSDELARQLEVARRAAEAANAAAAAIPDPVEHIAALRAQLPESVVAAYDAQKNESDVGAADFNGRTCGGCYIVLTGLDQQRINRAPADEMPRCPECGTYLIRKQAE